VKDENAQVLMMILWREKTEVDLLYLYTIDNLPQRGDAFVVGIGTGRIIRISKEDDSGSYLLSRMVVVGKLF